jgi:hypothetical protein
MNSEWTYMNSVGDIGELNELVCVCTYVCIERESW